jgi:chromosomal replication initiator protein
MAVAQKPGGTSFNPLMIYGQTGLGKTHLAQAIGNQIKQNFPQKTVLYVTSDKFSNQLVDAIKGGSAPDFINFYQLIDVLIVDDIQFFGGKEKTQEIFFHVFNHLHQNGKQLVLTCDRPPKDLKGMADRLLSRFKWGLSVDIQAPDLETRIAILEKKMYASGIDLPRDVVEFVAHNVTTNVRELEGALNSLLLNSTINKKEPTLDIAKQVMKNFVKNISMEISIESIQALVCEYFKIQQEALKSKSRKREIVQARQISMYFAKKLTKNSLKTIGEFFGGRDHSTVIHSCQTVEDLMETDRSFRGYVEEINKQIKLSTL